jgi:hypothetical protein
MLPNVGLTNRRVRYIGRFSQELSEQVERFTDMPINEPDRGCVLVQPQGRIVFRNSAERKAAGELS